MTHTVRNLVAAAVLGAMALAASAQTAAPAPAPAPAVAPAPVTAAKPALTTEQKQDNQATRITEGKQNGEITKHESRRLKAEQIGINRAEKHANADGKVTKREQNRLDNMQAKASKDIHRQKHDNAEKPAPAAK